MKERQFSVQIYSTSNADQKNDLEGYKTDFERLMSEFRGLSHTHEEGGDWTSGLALVALAFVHQQPIGFYLLSTPEEHGAALNRTVFVEEEWRGKKVSERMTKKIEKAAVSNGIKAIEIHPLLDSCLLEWYPKNGYSLVNNRSSVIFRKKLSPEFNNSLKPLFVG